MSPTKFNIAETIRANKKSIWSIFAHWGLSNCGAGAGAGEILRSEEAPVPSQEGFPFLIVPSVANEPLMVYEPAAFAEMQIFQGLHYYFFIHILFSLEMPNSNSLSEPGSPLCQEKDSRKEQLGMALRTSSLSDRIAVQGRLCHCVTVNEAFLHGSPRIWCKFPGFIPGHPPSSTYPWITEISSLSPVNCWCCKPYLLHRAFGHANITLSSPSTYSDLQLWTDQVQGLHASSRAYFQWIPSLCDDSFTLHSLTSYIYRFVS